MIRLDQASRIESSEWETPSALPAAPNGGYVALMPVTCLSCENALEADSLDAAAQTALCPKCGAVHPQVELPTGPTEGWLVTWLRPVDGGGVVARYEAPVVPSVLRTAVGVFLVAAGAFVISPVGRAVTVLLGALACGFAALHLRPTRVRMSRDGLEFLTPYRLSKRSVPAADLLGFRVEERDRGEEGKFHVVVARISPRPGVRPSVARRPPIMVFSHGNRSKSQKVCDRLNEALFLVMQPQVGAGPYR
jgi:hypothetical protein